MFPIKEWKEVNGKLTMTHLFSYGTQCAKMCSFCVKKTAKSRLRAGNLKRKLQVRYRNPSFSLSCSPAITGSRGEDDVSISWRDDLYNGRELDIAVNPERMTIEELEDLMFCNKNVEIFDK